MKKIKKKKYQKPTSECVEVASICTIVISGGGNASGGGAPPPMQSPSRPHWGLNDPSEEEEEDNTMFGRLW